MENVRYVIVSIAAMIAVFGEKVTTGEYKRIGLINSCFGDLRKSNDGTKAIISFISCPDILKPHISACYTGAQIAAQMEADRDNWYTEDPEE